MTQPDTSDLFAPSTPSQTASSLGGPHLSPDKHIHFYSPLEWEEFIREWAATLTERFVQVKRLGGPNDLGVDIAGFESDAQFEGAWRCFQAKHYADPLMPSDLYPELLKILSGVVAGDFTMPLSYEVLAPKGCGITLNRMLSRPSELKAAFIASIQNDRPLGRDLTPSHRNAIIAAGRDFTWVNSVELLDLITQHSRSPFHSMRFGLPLPQRPPGSPPPDEVQPTEVRYVDHLIDVYRERHPEDDIEQQALSVHPTVGVHFARQRVSFYRAEALRSYARDAVPPGTFDSLLEDVHAGVVDIADQDHPNGFERLSAVLTASTQIALDNNILINVSGPDDRKGLCHHLANVDRLKWVNGV